MNHILPRELRMHARPACPEQKNPFAGAEAIIGASGHLKRKMIMRLNPRNMPSGMIPHFFMRFLKGNNNMNILLRKTDEFFSNKNG